MKEVLVSSCLWFDDDDLVHYQKVLPKKLKEKYELLCKHIDMWKPGDRVTYDDITDKTGIIMDDNGKNLLRKALNDKKIAWLCFRGQGIELAYEGNAAKIADRRFRYVDRWNHSAGRTHYLVSDYVIKAGNPKNIEAHDRHAEAIETADRVVSAVSSYRATLDYDEAEKRTDESFRFGLGKQRYDSAEWWSSSGKTDDDDGAAAPPVV